MVRYGAAWLGKAGFVGLGGHGTARSGAAWQGSAVEVRQGAAWHGETGRGGRRGESHRRACQDLGRQRGPGLEWLGKVCGQALAWRCLVRRYWARKGIVM